MTGPGLPHNCNITARVQNLIKHSIASGEKGSEQVAAGILKNKMQTESIKSGKTFRISTGGSLLTVCIGTGGNKSARKPIGSISVEIIKELQVALELSERGTKVLCSKIRKGTGKRTSIEANIFGKLEHLQEELDCFYDVKAVDFEQSDGSITEKDLVVVRDASAFIQHIIRARSLDPANTVVRVSMDGGGGFLKIIVNVFEEGEAEISTAAERYLDSGVQRAQFLGIAAGIPENYNNLRIILEMLELNSLSYYIGNK